MFRVFRVFRVRVRVFRFFKVSIYVYMSIHIISIQRETEGETKSTSANIVFCTRHISLKTYVHARGEPTGSVSGKMLGVGPPVSKQLSKQIQPGPGFQKVTESPNRCINR